MDFTSPTHIASSSTNAPPVPSDFHIPFSTIQHIPLDQDPIDLETRNYSELKAIFNEKSDAEHNDQVSMKLSAGEDLAYRYHGYFDTLINDRKNCIKQLICPTEMINTIPDLCNLAECALCSLVSSEQEARSDLSQAVEMQLPLANVHVDEVIGTRHVPEVTVPVNGIRSIMLYPVVSFQEPTAPEKEEKNVEPAQSDTIEVQNAVMNSRPEEVELQSNEDAGLSFDVELEIELDVEFLHELMHRIYDLQIKVKERREWAEEKALQAARKVSNYFIELRVLRMKREIIERMKEENKAKEDALVILIKTIREEMKRNAKKVEMAQMEIEQLEKENKVVRAEIEAARLEKSEAANKCKIMEKRLKRINKGAEMRERQMLALQGEVNKAKKDNAEIEEQIEVVRNEISASEAKLEEEKKLTKQAAKLVEAEHKTATSAKNSCQTRLTILCRKLDLDRKRHNEQVKALEREITRLKRANSLRACDRVAEVCWPCIFCQAAESSVVFLPCAHQVLCADCGKDHEEIGSEKCPCCRVKVEERIYVYGLGV